MSRSASRGRTVRLTTGALLGACLCASTAGARDPIPPPPHASTAASHGLTLNPGADTELVSVSIHKAADDSAILIIGTVELVHSGTPTNKTVELSIHRGPVRVDGPYAARIGTVSRAVSEAPVTIHTLDEAPAGNYTYTLRARASHTGAEAGARRLSAIEVP